MPALVRGGCGAPLGFCKSSLRIHPAAGAAVLLRQSKEPMDQEGMTEGLVIREAEEPPLSGRGFLNMGSFRFSFCKLLACTLTASRRVETSFACSSLFQENIPSALGFEISGSK